MAPTDRPDLPADLVLRGGVVHTLATPATPATAIAVRGGRVARVGADPEVLALAGPRTELVDLAGRAVLPGINDSHLHATWLGALWPETLLGAGFGHAPQRPLRGPAEQRAAILRAGELLASLGITSYTEPGLGPGEDRGATGAFGRSVLEQYRSLAAQRLLPARVTVLSLFGELDGPSDLASFRAGLAATDPHSPCPDRLRIAGVKIFADGIPPMRSAYVHRGYRDGSRGRLLVDGADPAGRAEALAAMIGAAHRAGQQVGVHATGDAAIDATLDAITGARAGAGEGIGAELAHYLIHGDLVTPAQLDRMARLRVGLNLQPGIAVRTGALVDAVLGPGSAARAWPVQRALEAGVLLCLSSDAPVLTPDWRRQIAETDQWMGPAADPRARMAQLLRCYTVNPAVQDGAAGWKGTLAPGMAADLVVLAADPLAVAPAELPEVAVDLTVLAGEVVFDRTRPGGGAVRSAAGHRRPAG